MKKSFIKLMFLALLAVAVITSCKKDKGIDGTTWNLNVSVNLDGTFTVLATATFTVDGQNFSAAIATSQIGGAAEVHNFTINGTVDGEIYTVSNSAFNITVGSTTETITITSGSFTYSDPDIAGSGTVTSSLTPNPGTFTFTGTK